MKDESDNENGYFREIAGACAIVWVFTVIGGLCLLANHKDGTWAQLNYFEGVGTFIAGMGFLAVYYQLRMQRLDSKNADKKHEEILDRQQAIFEQNAKIALFEKRCRIHQLVFQYVKRVQLPPPVDKYYHENFLDNSSEAFFLFPEAPEINSDMIKLVELGKEFVALKQTFYGKLSDERKQLIEAKTHELNSHGTALLVSMYDALDLEYPKKKKTPQKSN